MSSSSLSASTLVSSDNVNLDDDDDYDGEYDVIEDEDDDMDDELRSPVSSSSLSASTLVSGLPEQVGSEQRIHCFTLFRFSICLLHYTLDRTVTDTAWL